MPLKTVFRPDNKIGRNILPRCERARSLVTHHGETGRQCIGSHAVVCNNRYRSQVMRYRMSGLRVYCMGETTPFRFVIVTIVT